MTALPYVLRNPRIDLRALGFGERDLPPPAQGHLERMLSVAHATAPLTPVALSLMGSEAVVPSLRDVVRDGSLSRLEQVLWHRFGVALRFSVSHQNAFYQSVCGGYLWGSYDGMPEVLTMFYSWHHHGHDPLYRERREHGLVILT